MPSGLIVLFVIIGVVAVIGIVAFVVYRFLSPKLKEEKPSEEQVLKENLDRYLQPIEDEETAKQVSNYKDDEE